MITTNIGPGKSGVINPDTFPVLYILMRGDLESMNAGKGMAQASHASNAFVFAELKKMLSRPWKSVKDFYKVFISGEMNDASLFIQWVHSTTQGFGTVLVIKVNEIEMRTAVEVGNKLDYICDVIHDPTYPLRDGDFCHFLPLDTCAYVFGDKNDPLLSAVVGNFPLHP